MANQQTKIPSVWIAIDKGSESSPSLSTYSLKLEGEPTLFNGMEEGDWILVSSPTGQAVRIANVIRVRSEIDSVTLYFERVQSVDGAQALASMGIELPERGLVRAVPWGTFEVACKTLMGATPSDVPKIGQNPKSPTYQQELAYIRELLQLAVMDDLLGPAGGPHEQIVDMSVRDRYLVGKFAPQNTTERGKDYVAPEDDEDSAELVVKSQAEGMDSPSAKGRGESEASGEVDTASNQSLVPSSFGMTFCVDGDATHIEVEARWGSYERLASEDHNHARPNGQKVKVWQRVPRGGTILLPLNEGPIPEEFRVSDIDCEAVRIQGAVRAKNEKGDRLVTLFLLNAQDEPDSNKDTAWIFQPEIIVRAAPDAVRKDVFRRRPILDADGQDPERESLEMIYRNRVEFAVGHGVAVHAKTASDVTLATEVRTAIMPQYEVQVTETPGLDRQDRPAMRQMVDNELLDMDKLASLDVDALECALGLLTQDYGEWIAEQKTRIGSDLVGYDEHANAAIARCEQINKRLQQGIETLKSNSDALAAFRVANKAMAVQRVRSQYSLEVRRGKTVTVDQFNVQKNRSWRPFQLAFLLLSIPALADPTHPDRVQPVEAYADLLWFPTGGGKTEAYLGVAAFTMAIRRMQKDLGGLDSSRGLAVIMRYTLRLLTLQQFQRATALICALEVQRREAIARGDMSLGDQPFTIGLWVGNKVTPGKTEDSHEAIQNIRNPNRFDAGAASPAQLTSCPWCGSKVEPGKHVDVDQGYGRTYVYCGDPLQRCEFSKGPSAMQPHPGLPVLTVDEEIYHRPPTMMIATVDKFAMMAWRGEVRTLFGRVDRECERHGLLWPGCDCNTGHQADKKKGLERAVVKSVKAIRPPDLIIQDEFHLISGPLGTMVGLYEAAVDELSSWKLGEHTVKPKVIASTATVRKADAQVNNVFMRKVSVFPPHGLDVEDNYFSVQRSIEERPGRRYIGVCSPGSSRPAMLIRVYTAFLTASQALFDRFGEAADPYMTMVGYFNSLRELGGMKRLAEDDVQTRSYRVQMSMVQRPALAQRSVSNIRELTSRVSSQDIPLYLDNLEVKFKTEWDAAASKFVSKWQQGDIRAIDVVLATNMLSVGVDVNRLGLMAVNGQPKGTAEYIQATSRVGRSFPGLVCTVLTWARPRDLSHYETFEHYHATFYKHVEAQSVTPFSPRAMDRGLTGSLLSLMRLENRPFSPNEGAGMLQAPNQAEIMEAIQTLTKRAAIVSENNLIKQRTESMLKVRADEWSKEASIPGRTLAYERRGPNAATIKNLIESPGVKSWDNWTVPMSMREVEPGVRLVMDSGPMTDDNAWLARPAPSEES